MRYLSLFSGIEAASVAWQPLDWKAMAFSEIDPFCCRVLSERFPSVPNLGDIRNIDCKEFISEYGKPDLIVGGSPCQSFSIAGDRTGRSGASGLMQEYIRVVSGLLPEWFIWENVPGAFSVEHGAAFRQLLSEMDALGYGLAWRVLDAQFFGVAQRRERVFLIGHLRECPPIEVLFERDGMPWNYQTSRKKREELTCTLVGSTQSASWCMSGTRPHSAVDENYSGTLLARESHEPHIVYAIAGNVIGRSDTAGGNGNGFDDLNGCYTLTATDVHGVAQTPYTLKLRHTGSENHGGGQGALWQENMSATLATSQDQTLFDSKHQVRKLTPYECELLQGFSGYHTAIDDAKDTQRYKAIGNSMAVPVMRWIGGRLEMSARGEIC